MQTLSPSTPNPSLFGRSRPALILALAVLFLAGLVIRLYDLNDLPLDFHPTRQLFTAIVARSYYYRDTPSAPAWERERAAAQLAAEETEPPSIDWLAAKTYQVIGRVDLYFPRLYSALFWLLAGIPLYLLARDLTNVDGGLLALGVYLLAPFGVSASRSFQPDPLMTALTIFSWWCMARWFNHPRPASGSRWIWAIVAGLLAAAAMLVKSLAAFTLLGGMAGVFFARDLRRSIRDIQFWVMGLTAAVPILAWSFYGFFGKGTLSSQFALRFFPNLWIDPVFYLRWEGMIEKVFGLLPFILALLAWFLFQGKERKVFAAGLWGGYLLFGFVFAYYFITHNYYHIALIPIAAISLAPLGQAAGQKLAECVRGRIARLALLGVILAGCATNLWNIRDDYHKANFHGQDAYWAHIGEVIQHDSRTVALTQDYGYRLAYWGWTTPVYWPYLGDQTLRQLAGLSLPEFQRQFEAITRGNDYFLVSDMQEYARQPQLQQTLSQGYPVFNQGEGYIIFDLRHPLAH
jgi:4-amino-4-deoxy-L-arabinose transferase-like glycosyltransferase